MKSGILVAKIGRAIETGGATEDGAALAGQYAEAANALNARLDAVVALIDSKQVSDAVRIMEEEPRLLDEINALDFMRLPDWDVVCVRRGWARPPKLDKTHIERVLLETGSMAAAESYLRMYRRAVRVNDQRLAVTSLRQLSKADSTKDWRENLLKAEVTLQARIAEEFRKARDGGDADKALQIARDFRGEPWLEQPSGKGAMDMLSYAEAADAAERAKEGAENVAILAKMFDGDWNTDSALSLLQGIDRIVEAGWAVPPESREVVDKCRSRCDADLAEREREAMWKACCEELYAAVQREDAAAVREAMAAFGPLDREPEEDLLRKAQLVVMHDEERCRRKMTLVTVCVVASLAAFIGISVILFNHKRFNDECVAEAAELEAIATSDNPIEPLRQKLERLKSEKPKVSADSRIDAYNARLGELITKNVARTNELVSILGELEAKMQEGWKEAPEHVVTGRIERAKSLVRDHDQDYGRRLLAVRTSFTNFKNERTGASRKSAEQSGETLLKHLDSLAERMKSRLADEGMRQDDENCTAELEQWRGSHSEYAPELDARVREAEAKLAEAKTAQNNLTNALAKFEAASNAVELVAARDALLKHYGGFDAVKALKPLPYGEADVADLLGGKSIDMDSFAGLFKTGIGDDEFRTFLKDDVAELRGSPANYSLYGVYATCWSGQKKYEGQMIALALGRPEISKAAPYKVSGTLFDFTPGNEGRSASELVFKKSGNAGSGEIAVNNPVSALLEPSREIQDVVDIAEKPGQTQSGFVDDILKLIDGHVAETRGASYFFEESEGTRFVKRGVIPAARRVQLLNLYLGWLRDDLKAMPPMSGMDDTLRELARLAQPVTVEEVSNKAVTWACLYERRVHNRNVECAKFLANRFPADFTARFRQALKVRSAMSKLSRMRVESAGRVAFDPVRNMERKGLLCLKVPPEVSTNHPLYILRIENGTPRLKKAIVWSWYKDKGKWQWMVASHAILDELLPGEPLFQVSIGGVPEDVEKWVGKTVKELPGGAAACAAYLKDVPYFGDMR